MRVRFSPDSKADLAELRTYWNSVNKTVTKRFVAAIRRDATYIGSQPFSGTPWVGDTRQSVVSHTPYVIVYSVGDRQVLIERIFHQAQDRPLPD